MLYVKYTNVVLTVFVKCGFMNEAFMMKCIYKYGYEDGNLVYLLSYSD